MNGSQVRITDPNSPYFGMVGTIVGQCNTGWQLDIAPAPGMPPWTQRVCWFGLKQIGPVKVREVRA